MMTSEEHLVRKLEKVIDCSFIYPMVEGLYSKNGRPSIDPVVLFKMIFIQYIYLTSVLCAKRKETIDVSLPMKRKSMELMQNPTWAKKNIYAGDAYFFLP